MCTHTEEDLDQMVEGNYQGEIDFQDLYELMGCFGTKEIFQYLGMSIAKLNADNDKA